MHVGYDLLIRYGNVWKYITGNIFKSTRKLSTQLLQVRENIGIFKSRRKILQLDSKLSRCWGKISCNIWKHNCFLCNLLLGRRENPIREMKVSLRDYCYLPQNQLSRKLSLAFPLIAISTPNWPKVLRKQGLT